MKKLISLCLTLSMVLSLAVPVFATDITTSGGSNEVPVELTQVASNFSVTVPTVLPVDVAADGTVTVATDNKIINNSWGPVEVKGVEVQPQNDWVLQEFTTDFKTKNVGIKEFGFRLNNTNVETDGGCAAEFEVIEGNSEISFTYDANVAAQKTALEDVQIAYVVFTMGWHDSGNSTSLEAGLYDSNGVMLCSWEDSGINVEIDYDNNPGYTNPYYKTEPSSLYYVLTNVYPDTVKVVVPNTITALGYMSFYFYKYLSTVILPNMLTTIGKYAFAHCEGLTTIDIPDSVTLMENDAFHNCYALESVVIGDGVQEINTSVFHGCKSLTSVDFGRNVNYIGQSSFHSCKALKSIVIPETVTHIDNQAFMNCTSLEEIVIPKTVTRIGIETFYLCGSLQNIYYTGTEEEWNAITKGTNWDRDTGNYTIHYNYAG